MYDARIEDLGSGDFLNVECVACGDDEMIPRTGLVVGLRLPGHMRVLDLQSRFRCRECDRRDKAVVSINRILDEAARREAHHRQGRQTALHPDAELSVLPWLPGARLAAAPFPFFPAQVIYIGPS